MKRRLTLQKRGPHEKIATIEDKVNSHSILSKLRFPKYSPLTTKLVLASTPGHRDRDAAGHYLPYRQSSIT